MLRLRILTGSPFNIGIDTETPYAGTLFGSTSSISSLERIIPIMVRASRVANCCPRLYRWKKMSIKIAFFSFGLLVNMLEVYILPDSGTSMESTELSLRGLLSVNPARGFVFFGIRTPDKLTSAHNIGAPGKPFTFIDLGTIGEDIILDTLLQVTRAWRVKTET